MPRACVGVAAGNIARSEWFADARSGGGATRFRREGNKSRDNGVQPGEGAGAVATGRWSWSTRSSAAEQPANHQSGNG